MKEMADIFNTKYFWYLSKIVNFLFISSVRRTMENRPLLLQNKFFSSSHFSLVLLGTTLLMDVILSFNTV